ncbi:hypothetical protein COOONC_07444 [Cooperia oncophora]
MTALVDSEAVDSPSPLPSKSLLKRFRKRLLSVDGKASALPATSRSSDDQSSPRRPLYVDIPLANGLNDKRKSPVTSVVDFVRGRNRTASLNLSGSATPPSPPAVSVSARASASTDGGMPTSPLFSPSRANVRPHLSRMYRPGMRSLDSGLDLSSPTIGHHALFIKEDFTPGSVFGLTISRISCLLSLDICFPRTVLF